ncbi:invasion associated locus B family protein [Arenibaculum pallidiluteum]|uniref:invasion associated locus B family protein n=1 Tax=Arenibaculum pallidiluteum TaxID=2812559 RepID=UPI001A96EEB0|nr:invasion associated locus B family protein [Arenibaculum pallidiluteum]
MSPRQPANRPAARPALRLRPLAAPFAAALLATFLAAAGPAAAQEPKSLGTSRDWAALALDEGSRKTCYIVSQPKNQEGNFTRRGQPFLMVTHRPSEKSLDVVSVLAGYSFQPGSEVTIQVGNQNFRLFTDGDSAWARDDSTDRQLVQAMRGGQTAVVRGTSSRGTKTTDTYSLAGFSASYQAINQACGVKR